MKDHTRFWRLFLWNDKNKWLIMCGFQYNETASVSQLLWRKTPNNHIHFISTGTIIYSSLFDLMLEKLPSNLIQKFLFLIITSLVVCLPRPDAVTFDWLYSDYLFLFLFLSNEKSLLIHYIVHFCWKPFITYSILICWKDWYSEPNEKEKRIVENAFILFSSGERFK